MTPFFRPGAGHRAGGRSGHLELRRAVRRLQRRAHQVHLLRRRRPQRARQPHDFNRLATNFGQSSRRWVHGDFNFDGLVNLADFNPLASNFGATDGPEVGEYYTYEELEQMLEDQN